MISNMTNDKALPTWLEIALVDCLGKEFSIHPLKGTHLQISGKIPCSEGILEFYVSKGKSSIKLKR